MKKEEQSAAILDRYIAEVNPDPVSLDEVADWALLKGLYHPSPRDIRKMCRDDLAAGARAQKRFDGKRWYRAKHSIRTNLGGVQLNLWADIDKNASRSFMEKSLSQRRRGVVNVCFSMKNDADHFNEANPKQAPLVMLFDMTDDVLELEAAMKVDPRKPPEDDDPEDPEDIAA